MSHLGHHVDDASVPRNVKAAITLRSAPDRVINAFLDPKALKAWWGVERSLVEPRTGGLYAIAWNISESGFGYVSTGTITAINPSSRLVIDAYTYFNPEREILGPMRLIVSAKDAGSGRSLVQVRQEGYQSGADWDWYHNAVTGAWPVVLESLKSYLETQENE